MCFSPCKNEQKKIAATNNDDEKKKHFWKLKSVFVCLFVCFFIFNVWNSCEKKIDWKKYCEES